MSGSGDVTDAEERRTAYAVLQHACDTAGEHATVLDHVLARMQAAVSGEGGGTLAANGGDQAITRGDDGGLSRFVTVSSYRDAELVLAELSETVVRSLTEFVTGAAFSR